MSFADTFHATSLGVAAVAAIACVFYVRHRRELRRTAYRPPGRAAPIAWGAAVLLFLVAMIGPLDWLGERRLMSAHMVQHLLLLSAVPGLVLFAWPVHWPGRAMSGEAAAGCLLAGVGTIWLLHLPAVLEPALTRPWLHELEHLALLAAGLLVALPLTSAGARLGFGAAFYLVAAELSIGALGIWLAWSPEIIYSSYEAAPRTWGLSVAADQSLAGALLLVVEEPFLAIEFAIVFLRALGDQW